MCRCKYTVQHYSHYNFRSIKLLFDMIIRTITRIDCTDILNLNLCHRYLHNIFFIKQESIWTNAYYFNAWVGYIKRYKRFIYWVPEKPLSTQTDNEDVMIGELRNKHTKSPIEELNDLAVCEALLLRIIQSLFHSISKHLVLLALFAIHKVANMLESSVKLHCTWKYIA